MSGKEHFKLKFEVGFVTETDYMNMSEQCRAAIPSDCQFYLLKIKIKTKVRYHELQSYIFI